MTPAYFRALILISVLTGITGGFVDSLFPSLVSPALSAALESEPLPTLFTESPCVSLVIFVSFLIAGIASTIGLFYFRRWARILSLVVFGVGFALTPFLGATLSSGLSYALIDLAATTWGAVLAVAYYSPLNQRFVPSGAAHER